MMSTFIHRSRPFKKALITTPVVLMFVLWVSVVWGVRVTIPRTWEIHDDCTDNVTSLTSGANSKLEEKDQDDDVVVCVTITKASVHTGWTFAGDVGNDGQVTSEFEEADFDVAAIVSDKNSFRLVHWNVTGHWCGFYAEDYGIVVMDDGGAATLAHEIGHYAGCSDSTEGKAHRIMKKSCSTTRNTVNSAERDKYEALD